MQHSEHDVRREITKALAIVFGGTLVLALIQLLVPATTQWMQLGLAFLLLQAPAWVLPKSVDQRQLGLTVGPYGRAVFVGFAVMLVVFPVFTLGHHFFQTEFVGAKSDWSAQNLARWDESLENRPAQPCNRADGSLSVWTYGPGMWLTVPSTSKVSVKVATDVPISAAREVHCTSGGVPQARRRARPDSAGSFSLPKGVGLWVPLSDAQSHVALEVRDASGALVPEDRIRTGQYGATADDDGVVSGSRDYWWLLQFIIVHLGLVALPEEWFFRGYLMSRLDQRFGTPLRVFGANLGWGLILSALAFALLHPILLPGAHRLLVFFPALLFGWVRARTGNVGAAIIVHAGSNLLIQCIGRMYV